MTAVNLNSIVRRRDVVLNTELDGELLMMDMDQDRYFGLNTVATKIWGCLGEPLVVADLIAPLTREFDAPPDLIEADVLDLLNSMAEHKLLVIQP